jgi:hypothetical protein
VWQASLDFRLIALVAALHLMLMGDDHTHSSTSLLLMLSSRISTLPTTLLPHTDPQAPSMRLL